jgi:superfamily II DNA/RNA helicase
VKPAQRFTHAHLLSNFVRLERGEFTAFEAAEITAKLSYTGLQIEALYSDADKQTRAGVMNRFKEGKSRLLLATDIASRGLDLPQVTHIFHFDPATDANQYIHRSGRTARMGRAGASISIVEEKERFIVRKFEKALHISIIEKKMVHGQISDQSPPSPPVKQLRSKSAQQRPTIEKRTDKPAVRSVKKLTKSARQRDQKNKGMPKWLKEKRKDNNSE